MRIHPTMRAKSRVCRQPVRLVNIDAAYQQKSVWSHGHLQSQLTRRRIAKYGRYTAGESKMERDTLQARRLSGFRD